MSEIVVMHKADYESMQAKQDRILEMLESKNGGWDWVISTEVPKLLGISAKTWQNMRDRRQIPFSQFGSKIYVKKSDIEAFLMSNYVPAK